jgi:hypothetical protein
VTDFSFDEPNHNYVLSLNITDPTKASYYIWEMSTDDWFAKDIEKITGKKVKRIYDHYYGNGHGDFRVEFTDCASDECVTERAKSLLLRGIDT